MGQNTTVLGIIGVVVIIVVLLSPTLLVAGQNVLNNLFAGWQSLWSSISGAGGTGNANIGATIHYEDGTEDTINADNGVPLTVTYGDAGKPLQSIDFHLYGVITYYGTLESIYMDGTIEFDFDRDGTPEKTNTNTGYDPNVSEVGSGNIYAPLLVTVSVSSGELEQWATESGEYITQVRGRGSIVVTFTDGEVSELQTEKDATGTFTFNISQMGAYTQILTAYVGTTPWY